MADKDDQDDAPGLEITDEEAEELLHDAVEADEAEEDGDESERDSDDSDISRLQADIQRWKTLSRKNEKAFRETSTKLKKYEDEGKSELQRLQEERDELKNTSTKTSARAKALEIALERAPEHATLTQVRAVAKRVRGDDDDALERDADELFELLAPESKAAGKTVAGGRPKERLKGGSAEPDEDPEETDPAKLAALLPRRR